MDWFDDIFRALGPLLPLLPWGLRCISCLSWKSSSDVAENARVSALSGSQSLDASHACGSHRTRPPLKSTLPLSCLSAYVTVGAVRLGLYLLHLVVQRHGGGTEGTPWVSDHVFLASSVVACLQAEMICSLSDVIRLELNGSGEITLDHT